MDRGARSETNYFALALALTVAAAIFSASYFHPDEHFQTLEFASLKLGRATPATAVPEYVLKMRSWLLPFVDTMWVRLFEACGLRNPFTQVMMLRLLHGALSLSATVALMRSVFSDRDVSNGQKPEAWRWSWVWLFAFVPYLAVRTSAENVAGALFAWSFVMFERARTAQVMRPGRAALLGGALLGMAFEVRFQILFLAAGYLLALIVRKRRVRLASAAWAAAGFVGAIALGALCNRWGYGSWEFPLLSYYTQNISKGMARSFGVEPWFAFSYLPIVNVCMPAAVLCIVAAAHFVYKHPRHALSCILTVGLVGQSVFSHKEERFLFPMIPVGLAAAAVSMTEVRGRWQQLVQRLGRAAWLPRVLFALACFANALVMILLVFFPLNWRGSYRVHRVIDAASKEGSTRVVDVAGNASRMPFYSSVPWYAPAPPLSCNGYHTTLVLVDALAPTLPAAEANCAYTLRMSELEMLAPVISSAMMTKFAHALPGKPAPKVRWHAVYALRAKP